MHAALQLGIEGGETKTFAAVDFDQTRPYHAGLFVSGDTAASVRVTATVLDAGCVIARGSVVVAGVAAGQTAGPVDLLVAAVEMTCAADAGPDARDGALDHVTVGTGGDLGTGG